ncbi:MAG TPA: putative collagen-binding domain-containing protein, partial [Planctomycetaceae bacterium]|nr:putative collagen-binding domain-containing protein [Planctomycetaceae bacterium]
DESGSAAHGQCPDLGYKGFDGHDKTGSLIYTEHEVRQQTLWGTLMAGGAGCEYYFGYQFAENDLVCEDWRSRDRSWDYCRIAIQFFHENKIPFWEMQNRDELVGNPRHGISKFCFAKENEVYLVYLPNGGSSSLDLRKAPGKYTVHWFNPREGGTLQAGSTSEVSGGADATLGNPPADADRDWLVVVRQAD